MASESSSITLPRVERADRLVLVGFEALGMLSASSMVVRQLREEVEAASQSRAVGIGNPSSSISTISLTLG